jgi:hypothetical protein
LPRGKITESAKAPLGGSHKVDVAPSLLGMLAKREVPTPKLAVDWSSQAYTQEEWSRDSIPIFSKALGKPTQAAKVVSQETLSKDRWIHLLMVSDVPLAIGVVRCDPKFMVTLIYGHYRDPSRQMRETRDILESVKCAVTDRNRGGLSAATRLPATFGRTAETDFTGYKSLDGEVLMVNFTTGNVSRDKAIYKTVVRALVSQISGSDLPESSLEYVASPPVQRPAALVKVRIPGSEGLLYVGSQFCAPHEQSLMMIWTAPHASDALAQERLGQLGCPGDPTTDLPPFRQIAADACARGEVSACTASDTVD